MTTGIALEARPWGDLARLMRRALRHNLPLILIVLAYLVAGHLEERMLGLEVRSHLSSVTYLMSKFLLIVAFLVFCLYLAYLALVVRPARVFVFAFEQLRTVFCSWERWAYALPIIVLLPPFFATFTAIKTMIPVAQPFAWDPLFAEWDRWLHFGTHPWQWIHPILGHPLATKAIHQVYIAWLLSIHIVLFWQTFSLKDRLLRMQFFIAFVLTWALVGSLGGTLLSSAGPIYYERVTGLADPFAPLIAHLQALRDTSGFGLIDLQEWLWSTYANGLTKEYAGISAMPSMHVAIVTLLAILGWRTHRYLGMALTVFALLIMVGSVHLAWHYAIDGYAGALGAGLIWVATGCILRRWPALIGLDPGQAEGKS